MNYKIFLLLGSNMGNSKAIFELTKIAIENEIGIVKKTSSLYTTAAWGNTNQADFLNQVLFIHSILKPHEILDIILSIEKKIGRVRTIKNAPRVIDIDILFFNTEIIKTNDLIIPHPEIANRRFVLTPLTEIAPNFIHPILNKTNKQLLFACPDQLNVQKI